QPHQVADVLAGQQEADAHDRLAELLDLAGVGHVLRAVDQPDLALARQQLVRDVWRRRHQLQLALALQALLDDLAVPPAEEAAAEAEAEALAGFGLVGKAGVVEPQLAERLAERLEVAVLDRVQPAEDHRLRLLVAG